METKKKHAKKSAPASAPKAKNAPEVGAHRTVFQDGKVHRIRLPRKPGHAEEPREFALPGHATQHGKKEKAK